MLDIIPVGAFLDFAEGGDCDAVVRVVVASIEVVNSLQTHLALRRMQVWCEGKELIEEKQLQGSSWGEREVLIMSWREEALNHLLL